MKYKLAIFDLDGTILNTLEDLADSCNHILYQFNLPLHTTNEIRFMVGNGIPKLIERAIPDGKNNCKYNDILQSFINYYEKNCSNKTTPYQGIEEALQKMKKDGIKLAVNSNKVSAAAEQLCNYYFPNIFDFVSGSSPDIPVKPNPAGVEKILHHLEMKKEKTVYIGDSDVDIITAQNAGIDSISVSWGFRDFEFLKKNNAKCIVDNVEQLLQKVYKV